MHEQGCVFKKLLIFEVVERKISMSKNLVIVESPAKAKTIEGYLGKDYTVTSSMGHIRDLAKGNALVSTIFHALDGT